MPVYEELTRENVRVELVHEGEGLSGDFGEVPNDKRILRLTVYKKIGRSWEQVENGSVATRLSKDMPAEPKIGLINLTMETVFDRVQADESIKKTMEELSWYAPPTCPS